MTHDQIMEQARAIEKDIIARLAELDGAEATPRSANKSEPVTAPQLKEKTSAMESTIDMLKGNFDEASRVAPPTTANRKAVSLLKSQLQNAGVAPDFLDTPLGTDIAENLLPVLLHFAATAVGNTGRIPHMDKLASGAKYASRGAMIHGMENVIEAVVPFLGAYVNIYSGIDASAPETVTVDSEKVA